MSSARMPPRPARAQVLQPGQALQLVGAQLHCSPAALPPAGACRCGAGAGPGARPASPAAASRCSSHSRCPRGGLAPARRAGPRCGGLPRAQAQWVAFPALLAGRVGEQVHHGTHDGLERPGGRLDAFAAGARSWMMARSRWRPSAARSASGHRGAAGRPAAGPGPGFRRRSRCPASAARRLRARAA